MTNIGYALSSEEHGPQKLVELAHSAEKTGFSFAYISDHFHPWIRKQGQSGFVWGILGAISQATKKISIGTGVTCPIIRTHPAIIAQAAATAALLLPGRFMLGVGTGENLNEHITGDGWPTITLRRHMLIEAIEIIRMLWEGGNKNYFGRFYNVEDATIFSLPDQMPPIHVASSGPLSAQLAGEYGDGLIATSPNEKVVNKFKDAGGKGKPIYGQLTVCVDNDEKTAQKTAYEWWPNSALSGQLGQELRTPVYFEQATSTLSTEKVAASIICSQDPEKHKEAIQKFITAGFDNVYIHQVGPKQELFFDFYTRHILPEFQ